MFTMINIHCSEINNFNEVLLETLYYISRYNFKYEIPNFLI